LNYVDVGHAPTDMPQGYFQATVGDADKVSIFVSDGRPQYGLDLYPHEFGHALLHQARRAAGLNDLIYYRESASIDEGFGDLFAIAFNQQHQALQSPWYCVSTRLAAGGFQCNENTQLPFLSPLHSGQPEYYHDSHYADYIDAPNSTCDSKVIDTDNCASLIGTRP